jgi:DNA-binding MarR family transcriptional regulator
MLDKNSDVSRLLDRLIAKSLVKKSQCPNDKRATDIIITETGLSLLKELDSAIHNMEKKILQLSTEESNQLSELLDRSRG